MNKLKLDSIHVPSNLSSVVDNSIQRAKKEEGKFMKRKFSKSIAIAAAVALLATSVFAATNFEVLRQFFAGDSSLVASEVKTPGVSISNERFELTLEEVLSDGMQVFAVCSIRGLDDAAVSELMSDNMFTHPEVDFRGNITSVSSSEIEEKRTADMRYFAYWIDGIDMFGNEMIKMSSHFIGQEYISIGTYYSDIAGLTESFELVGIQDITIPTDTNVELREFVLTEQPYIGGKVKISPLGIMIEKGFEGEDWQFAIPTELIDDVYFRMKDGELKSYLEIVIPSTSGLVTGGFNENNITYYICRFSGRFREVTPFESFKSIIVGGIEYSINNGQVIVSDN